MGGRRTRIIYPESVAELLPEELHQSLDVAAEDPEEFLPRDTVGFRGGGDLVVLVRLVVRVGSDTGRDLPKRPQPSSVPSRKESEQATGLPDS